MNVKDFTLYNLEKYQFRFYETEADIQAEIYHQCRLHEIKCYLEVTVPRIGRLDCVLEFIGNYLIIECKNFINKKTFTKLTELEEYQVSKYLKTGYPVFIIYQKEQIQKLIEMLFLDIKLENKVYIYNKVLKQFVYQ